VHCCSGSFSVVFPSLSSIIHINTSAHPPCPGKAIYW
jgi:hypothetical protein